MRIKNLIIALLVAYIALSCKSGNGTKSSARINEPFSGVEKIIKAYNDADDSDERDFNTRYNELKANIEAHLQKSIGTELLTNVSDEFPGVVNSNFTVAKANGNIGQSTAIPYLWLSADITMNEGAEKQKVGFICRNGKGLPVFAGLESVSDGKVIIEIDFPLPGDGEKAYITSKVLSSVAQIDILSANELENHMITTDYYGGFGPIRLKNSIDGIPDQLAGVFDKKESGIVLNANAITLSSGKKKVADCFYDADNIIQEIHIYSSDLFVLNPYGGNIPGHCNIPARLMLGDPYNGWGIMSYNVNTEVVYPTIKVGYARFTGFQTTEPVNDSSFYGDVLDSNSICNCIQLYSN